MITPFRSLILASLALAAVTAQAKGPSPKVNEGATARHLASLLAGGAPKMAELTLFMSQLPKGGDLHHHYSGALYAEQYLDWVDQQGYCVNKFTFRIETTKSVIDAQRAMKPMDRSCLSTGEVLADDYTYRELLQRWSSKDFDNHGAVQPPPDRQFFETFGYFGPVAHTNYNLGTRRLKERAIAENLGYIETMFELAPMVANADFDAAMARGGADDPAQLKAALEALDKDAGFGQRIADYVAKVKEAHASIDDASFTMRYQAYVLRLLGPSQVFSAMVAGFKAAGQSELVVGVNIVGAENNAVAMRDYAMHMKMFQFLKAQYPNVKVALHAGELALGMVQPEGLKFHIDQALAVGGADRIGHGMDLAHERNALGIMKMMREKDIPVEINLSSNDFILGIKGEAHPVTLYRKYQVPFVISTDDAGVSRNNLSNEYVLFASRYKPDYAELKKVSYNGVRYAFLPETEKKRLTKQLDERFLKFEADIAALAAPRKR
ncbi:MAG: adenosine deaminase [Pseudomonadota bacterium]